MKSGVAHIISAPGQRVQGLIMPNSGQPAPSGTPKAPP
jgi:hypothetical protein